MKPNTKAVTSAAKMIMMMKKLMQIQRKVYNIKNDETSNTPKAFKKE